MPHPRPSLRARRRRETRRGGLAAGLAGVLVGAVTVSGAGAPAPAAAAPAEPAQALQVALDTLSPAVVPGRGPVRMSGSVTNTTDETWTDVRLYAFSGAVPILTEAGLEEAVATDPGVEVGGRTTQDGTFDAVEELAPGRSARWSIRVPRGLLDIPTGTPGVYWLGVHALGTSSAGRDGFADGRARTFVPAVPRTAPTVPLSLVLPLRRPVAHEPDGSVAGVAGWLADLGPGGRLGSVLDLGAAGSSRPLTWLVDPAVLEAVRRLAAGNPGRSLAPTLPPEGQDPGEEPSGTAGASPAPSVESGGTDSPTAAGSPDGSGGTDGGETGGEGTGTDETAPPEPPTAVEQEAAALAGPWLARATRLIATGELALLPHGDLDVAAAVHRAPDLYSRATALGTATVEALELPATPVAAPPDGRLDGDSIRALASQALVLLHPDALPDDTPRVSEVADHPVVLTDPAAAAGGPGPDAPLGTVAVRQRLLAETALAALDPEGGVAARQPVVAVLPQAWRAGDGRGFFAGLDQAPWVRLQSLGTTASEPTGEVDPDALVYGEEQRRAEVPTANLEAVAAAVRSGALLESVLTRNDRVGAVVARQALSSASHAARLRPRRWREAADGIREGVAATLGEVTVEAPDAVTLSSESGGFPASVANQLDEPVTVRVEARTTSPMTITAPAEVALEPGERTSVLLTARTRQIGLHDVELVVTSTDGVPLGSSDTVVIRSAQVSWIIWLVVAGGGVLLFGAIGVRLVRRLRAARRTPSGAA